MSDRDIQIGRQEAVLGQKWTTEYVFRTHDLKIVDRDFRDSICSVAVGWSRATACKSGACP